MRTIKGRALKLHSLGTRLPDLKQTASLRIPSRPERIVKRSNKHPRSGIEHGAKHPRLTIIFHTATWRIFCRQKTSRRSKNKG
jgi:hypothetical protein